MMNEVIKRNLIGKPAALAGEYIVDRFTSILYEQPKSGTELEDLKKWIDTGGSVVLVFGPHKSMIDPTVITQGLVNDKLKIRDPERFAWIFSSKYTGDLPQLGNMGVFSTAWKEYAARCGLSAYPAVQRRYWHKLDEDGIRDANALNKHTTDRTIECLSRPGSVVALALEDGRYQEGGFQRADPGSSGLFIRLRHSDRVRVQPVLIRGSDKFQQVDAKGFRGIHWRNLPIDVTLVVGQMITTAEILEGAKQLAWRDELWGDDRRENRFTASDYLAFVLASYDPERYIPGKDPRGVYIPENIVHLS